jgi:hypothetical protein
MHLDCRLLAESFASAILREISAPPRLAIPVSPEEIRFSSDRIGT